MGWGGGGSIDSNVSNIRSNPLSHVYLQEGMLPTIAWEKKTAFDGHQRNPV